MKRAAKDDKLAVSRQCFLMPPFGALRSYASSPSADVGVKCLKFGSSLLKRPFQKASARPDSDATLPKGRFTSVVLLYGLPI